LRRFRVIVVCVQRTRAARDDANLQRITQHAHTLRRTSPRRTTRDSSLHSGTGSPITTETEQPSFRYLCSKGVSVMAKKAKKKATKKAGRKKATKKTARRKK